tara:strand:+ start:205 stop:678 length:474 start_codon:yes stop_codon:yes gene_type:complete
MPNFLKELKNCIDKSKHFNWYDYDESNFGFTFDIKTDKVIKDLKYYKVLKSDKIESFLKQLNLYEFKSVKNVKNSKEKIYIHEKIQKKKNKKGSYEYDISEIKRRKENRKRKKIYDDDMWFDIINDFMDGMSDVMSDDDYSGSTDFKLKPLFVPNDL